MTILDRRRAGEYSGLTSEILQPCQHPGCTQPGQAGPYCERHRPVQARADRREASKSWQHLYKSARYQRMRRIFMIKHPYCIRCGLPGTDLDHIVPHKGDATLFWDQKNWQALCKSCHSKKTAQGE